VEQNVVKPEKPPSWQKGRRVFEVTLPARLTKSGKDEKVKWGFRWEVRATKPTTERGRTLQEMAWARSCLDRASSPWNRPQGFPTFNPRDLDSALSHAITAWCRTHLRGKASGNMANYSAFEAKAPDLLTRQVSEAIEALRRLDRGLATPVDAIAPVRTAVESLLDAAAHPPRNRRRFPARLKSDRPVYKPRVKPGGWIATGRYRPAQVLAVMDHPPHIMTLSYGDEVDDDFRPHVTWWKTVRMRKRPPSLKDVFSAGDWIRHARFGYGRVLTVRDSTMDVAFRKREETLVPDARLRNIEKVDGPAPEDNRPFDERFPPGTWIERGCSAPAVVIAIDEDWVTVLTSEGLTRFGKLGEDPVIWKLDRPPFDLTLPRERRRLWWWRNNTLRRGHRPCPCCGYLNLGIGDEACIEPVQCLICGWADDWSREEDADEVIPVPDPDDWEPPNWGYSLTEARRNFEAQGLMFRPDDPRATPFMAAGTVRRRLVRQLDRIMARASDRSEETWAMVERLRRQILDMLRGESARS
jgi:hypothetical protein